VMSDLQQQQNSRCRAAAAAHAQYVRPSSSCTHGSDLCLTVKGAVSASSAVL
jgi:hypothetical protein